MVDLSSTELYLFQDFLSRESGIHFDQGKSQNLQHALLERMQKLRINSYQGYYDFLLNSHEAQSETDELFSLVTIPETHFFRNPAQFEVLREFVLPEIISRKDRDKSLRVWSAGCSKGDEPYSLAIAIMEALPDYQSWQMSILATDINRKAISFAQKAVYPEKSIHNLPEGYLERYFKQDGKNHILNSEVKGLVNFTYHNLAKRPYPLEDADIIFCRNVIIYFDLETIKRVIENFYQSLKPGGYLFLGHSESLWQINDKFKTVEFPQTFIYQKAIAAGKEEVRPFIGVPEIKFEEFIDAKEPDKTIVHADFQRATELANQGNYQEAKGQLKRIIRQDNLHAEAYYLLGVLAYRTGDLKEAEEQFRRVIYIDHNIELAYFNLAQIYASQNKYARATREFNNTIRLLEKKPMDEQVRFSEDFTVEILLTTCKNNLSQIAKEGVAL